MEDKFSYDVFQSYYKQDDDFNNITDDNHEVASFVNSAHTFKDHFHNDYMSDIKTTKNQVFRYHPSCEKVRFLFSTNSIENDVYKEYFQPELIELYNIFESKNYQFKLILSNI